MIRTDPILLVTLEFDAQSFLRLDTARKRWFPPERNRIPAHMTLFHGLPASEFDFVQETLHATCRQFFAFDVHFEKLAPLGNRGFVVDVQSPSSHLFRSRLAQRFEPWLKPQDRAAFWPHVTLMNKSTPERAREAFEECAIEWIPWKGHAVGALLWNYLGGPWELRASMPFQAR